MRYEYDVTGGMRVADNNWARIRRVFLPNGQVKRETQTIRTYETQAPNKCGGGDRHAAAYAQSSTDWNKHSYILDYTYDLAGRRTTLKVPTQLDPCAGVCMQSYFYGALGHLDSLWHPSATGSSLTTRFTYDARGRPVTTTWPGGGNLTLGYDAEDRITSRVGAGGLPTNDTLSHDATGRVLSGSVANPAGGSPFQPAMEYNGLGALQRAVSLATGLTSEDYKTDALGSQLWVRDADMIDGINRTRLQNHNSVTGQLLSIELGTPGSGSCPSYNESCHPAWYQYAHEQSYDASGNVVSMWEIDTKGSSSETADQQPTESRSYYAADERLTYFNRMHGWIIVTGQGSGTFDEYRYDALGRRVLARTRRPGSCPTPCDAFIERTVYDGDQVLAEIRSSGAAGTSSTYMEAEGGVSQTGTTPGWSNPGVPWLYGIVLYAHGPGLDQPAHIAKYRPDSGWVTLTPQLNWRGAYGYGVLASGTVCTTGSPGRCPSSWPGFSEGAYGSELGVDPPSYASWYGSLVRGRRDASGLTYLRNRYYDPATGQFTQLDPIGLAGGLNLYGFAGGDPINFSDPFGLCPPENDDPRDCPGFWTAVGAMTGALMGGVAGGGGGFVAGAGVGALPGAAVGAAEGAAFGARLGAVADGLILASKAQGWAVGKVEQLRGQIEGHLGTIGQDPNAQDANHHRGEVSGWLSKARDYLKNMKGKTQARYREQIDAWQKQLDATTPPPQS
jgi:RHS repeat-associated protein